MSDIDTGRRSFVAGAAIAGAAAAASPVLAQEAPKAAGAPTTPKAASYPKPPFSVQRQPWPRLASKMTPRPDHREQSYKGSGRLADKGALIIGGDSGVGRAAAIAYAREGADVAINYLPAEEPDAREVVELIRAAGRKAVAIPGDLRDEAICRRLVVRAAAELGGLDIPVNNSARQQTKSAIGDISSDDFDATMKTDVYAPFWITKAAVARMGPGGVVVNTSSEQAADPSQDLVDYAMTRAAVLNFTKLWPSSSHPRERGGTGPLFRRRFKSVAARRPRSSRSSVRRARSGVPDSQPRSPTSTSRLPTLPSATRRVRSSAPPAAADNQHDLRSKWHDDQARSHAARCGCGERQERA